ncbi:MAG: iron ABC transporter [Phycisphaerae bacterium]|nr:iron ABC transporter [Phycisphaerae bacterium]
MMTAIDWWIIVIGALCASACALPGTLLVLRRMSLMGEAISHTVLPGIAIAFLVTGTRDPISMFIGAIVIGILTALFVHVIQTYGKVEIGASIGIVFTVLFAFGLILIRQALDHVHIDPDCVLYGSIEFAYFEQEDLFGYMVPRSFIINGAMLLVNALLLLLFYKEMKIASFDHALAKSQGFKPELMHYVLMTMTAVTAVAAFESVGSILVVAMFIVPPATAYLLTDRYWMLMVIAIIVACLSSVIGHLSAITVPTWFGFSGTVTSGAMAVATGALFVIAWICSPRHGLVALVVNRMVVKVKILKEDVLGILWRLEERDQHSLVKQQLQELLQSNKTMFAIAMFSLKKSGSVQSHAGIVQLTEDGRTQASSIIRTHRLWEVYLDKHFPQDTHQLHHSASRLEHVTTDAMQEKLGTATHDPHGSEVPQIKDE